MLVPIACSRTIVKALTVAFLAVFGLTAMAFAERPAPGDTWSHIAALPPSTHLHIAADTKGRTCFLVSSDEEKLVCSKSKTLSGSSYTFTRADVKSVKLTRYGRSTLVGLLVGGGAGAGVGAIVGQIKSPNDPKAFLDFSGLSRDVDIGIGAIVGLAAGGGIGGPTDWLRGPTIYLRPTSKH